MRALHRYILTFAICGLLAACAAPTLPTPPPSAEVALIGTEAVVTGQIEPGGIVACLNEDTGRGALETADSEGDFVVRIAAEAGDHLTLWQVSGSTPGQLLELVVPAASP